MGKKKRGKKSCFYLWLEHSLLGSSVQVKGTSGAVGNQIYSICQFPQCKYCPHDLFQATKVKLLCVCVCVCVCAHTQSVSCVQLFVTTWTVARQPPLSMEFSRKEYWIGCIFLLQGIFPTQGLHLLHLLHWQMGSLPLATWVELGCGGRHAHEALRSQYDLVPGNHCLQASPGPGVSRQRWRSCLWSAVLRETGQP